MLRAEHHWVKVCLALLESESGAFSWSGRAQRQLKKWWCVAIRLSLSAFPWRSPPRRRASRGAGSPDPPACSHTFLLTILYVWSERAAASGAANKVLTSAWKWFKAPSSQNRQALLTRGAARQNSGCAHILCSMRY